MRILTNFLLAQSCNPTPLAQSTHHHIREGPRPSCEQNKQINVEKAAADATGKIKILEKDVAGATGEKDKNTKKLPQAPEKHISAAKSAELLRNPANHKKAVVERYKFLRQKCRICTFLRQKQKHSVWL